jgi:hypothetical protein
MIQVFKTCNQFVMYSELGICKAHRKKIFGVLVRDLSANCILEVHSEFAGYDIVTIC